MRVETRTFQAALKSYGFDPGPLDGILGALTRNAIQLFAEWVEFSEGGGELWGDYTIMPAADNRSVEITPDAAARRFQSRGSAYLAANPEEIVFPRTRAATTTRATTTTRVEEDAALAPELPAPLALPFFRTSNPWAWLLLSFGLLTLSGAAFWTARRLRRR